MSVRAYPSALRRLLALSVVGRERRWLVAAVAFAPAGALVTVSALVGTKYLVDAVASRNLHNALVALGATAVLILGASAAQYVSFYAGARVEETSRLGVDLELMRLVAAGPTVQHLESPRYLDDLQTLRGQRDLLTTVPILLSQNAATAAQIVVTGVLLAGIQPWLLLLPLFALPSLWTSARASAITFGMSERIAEPLRRSDQLFRIGTRVAGGKELRVFAARVRFRAIYQRDVERISRETIRATGRASLVSACGSVVFAVGYLAALALTVHAAADGHASPGDVVLAFGLAAQVNWLVTGAVTIMGNATRAARGARLLARLQDETRHVEVDPSPGASPPARPGPYPIELRGVSFTYPGASRSSLDTVNLLLPAGAVVAIVGENGAGKTTLARVIAGLYEPSEGGVLVGGIRLERGSLHAWHDRLSGVLQDFERFELTVRQSVGVGHLPAGFEAGVVLSCMRAAGAGIPPGEHGIDTQLGRTWTGGIELSGGEWQRVAVARGLMHPQPAVMIFDEPTASLDPEAEAALIDRVLAARRERGAPTVVVISHRLSSCRQADLIVYLENGRVVELGAHKDLLRARGRYAALFETQASWYAGGRLASGDGH